MPNNWTAEDDGSYRMSLSEEAGSFTIRLAEKNEEFEPVLNLPNLSPIKESVPTYVLRHNSNVLRTGTDIVELVEYADRLDNRLSRE